MRRKDAMDTQQCGEYTVTVYPDDDAHHLNPAEDVEGCRVLYPPHAYNARDVWEWVAYQIDPDLRYDDDGNARDDDEIQDAIGEKYVVETYTSEGIVVFIGEDEEAFPTGIADVYRLWAEGCIYGFEITDPSGSVVDSQWGFIGDDFGAAAMAEGLDVARYLGPAEYPIVIHVDRDQKARIERAAGGDLAAWILAKIDE